MDHQYEYMEGSFRASFPSLYEFQCPDWFRDAKFGIWSHWGPQSVPMYGDWYARNMYVEGSDQYRYHLRHYGHPSQYGYLDIVKQWKAEKFDPDSLMDLYVKAGAKYFISQAMHHDNFFNYNSRINRYNSVNMGPKKDIVALWKAAAMKRGLHFGLSEHHGACFEWFNTNKLSDTKGLYAEVPYDGNKPELLDYYLDNKHTVQPGHVRRHYTWDENWYPRWYQAVKEVVDRYLPEILFSDGALPFYRNYAKIEDQTYLPGLAIAAHLYNCSEKIWGRNQAVYLHKDGREEYHKVGLLDFERSIGAEISPRPWQTDTCIGNWFYDVRANYKEPSQIIDLLVDIVSKNGNMLLNVPQLPDGTIDEECSYILTELAKWHSVCGEGIYKTRPYTISGEGPTEVLAETKTQWTRYDIRYTCKKNTVFAFLMGRSLHAVLQDLPDVLRVQRVTLLGYGEIPFRNESSILIADLPKQMPAAYANCLKLDL